MSATASWLVQEAIVTALRDDATYVALCPRTYDRVPEAAVFPYTVVGEGTESEELYFGQGGHLVKPEIFVYTQDGSPTPVSTGAAGYKQGLLIVDRIATVLQSGSLTVDGHDVVMVNQADDWTKERLEDMITRVIRPKFEITLEDAESV